MGLNAASNLKRAKMSSINTKRGNLFSSGKEYALGHCVSKDLNMGAGIAVEFKKRFKNIGTLKLQNKQVGQVAKLRLHGRYIFYMITKEYYWQKPTYKNIQLCLRNLRRLCEKYSINRLAMPKISCGIDGKSWTKVKRLISQEFYRSNIKVVIYVYSPKQ